MRAPKQIPNLSNLDKCPCGCWCVKLSSHLSHLQCRWSRSRSKERPYIGRANHHSESTDYAADNSSDQSPTHSPRHKATAYGDSPLARSHLLLDDKRDSLSSHIELENNESVKADMTAAQVSRMIDSSSYRARSVRCLLLAV